MIPLATLTAQKIINCYDLMDAAYHNSAIIAHSRSLGHVPLIDKNPRTNQKLKSNIEAERMAKKSLNLVFPEDRRYNERITSERANSRLKDEFGACKLGVRSHEKASCHLMFRVLALAADQLMRRVHNREIRFA